MRQKQSWQMGPRQTEVGNRIASPSHCKVRLAWAPWQSDCLAHHTQALSTILVSQKRNKETSRAAHTCIPRTWAVEAEGPDVHGHPQLHVIWTSAGAYQAMWETSAGGFSDTLLIQSSTLFWSLSNLHKIYQSNHSLVSIAKQSPIILRQIWGKFS